jgi:D-3-phosphoglycerate dehydrogenase
MSKVVVVGDTFVSSDTLKKAATLMALPEPVEIVCLEWRSDDSPEEFQRNLKLIEQTGPEALATSPEIMEEITDADFLFVHLAPIPRKLTTTSSGPTHPSTTTAKDHGRKLQGG